MDSRATKSPCFSPVSYLLGQTDGIIHVLVVSENEGLSMIQDQEKAWACRQVLQYTLSTADVSNRYKFSGLKQHKFILLQFMRSEV